MSRSQTRYRSRPSAGKSPSRRSPSRQSPAGSPDIQDRNLRARQVRVTLARLEMPKVDSSRKTRRTEESEMQNEGSNDVKPRRSIRTASNEFKAEQDNQMPMLRRGNKTSSQYANSDTDKYVQNDAKGKKKADSSSSKPQEWAGWFGALLLTLSMPICIPLMQLACMNDHCGMDNFRIPNLKDWTLFFDQNAFLLYAGYLCFLAIMSMLPIGSIVTSQQRKSGTLPYRINGLWKLTIAASALVGCVYQGYGIDEYLIKNSLQLSMAGLVYGLILSIALYIKASRAPASSLNDYGSSNSFIYNFWQGREINPRIGPVDLKQLLFESTVISTDLINLAAAMKILKEAGSLNWNNLGNLNVAALAVISFQLVFFVDKLISEAKFLSTFEMTYEGMGYMLCTGYLIYPYLSTLSTRYLLVHKVQLPSYLTVFWAVVFFVGFYLYRASNNQKDEFRRNPFSPSVAHLETIPTPAGKRLLVSGFWGYVRRPNYLGDILMHLAWAFVGFAPDIIPNFLAIFTTLLLIHRAIRDEARCEKRYGFAWKQYCERVKYIILPPIF